MQHKNSVIFLKDWAILVKSLPVEKQIIFWDLFIGYPNSECLDEFVKPIWNFIEVQLKNMDENYQKKIVDRNRENGKNGGRPKKDTDIQLDKETEENQKNPMGLLETQKTLNVNVNENINVNENSIDSSEIKISDLPISENQSNKKSFNLETETEKRKKVAPKKEIDERELDFKQQIFPYVEKYGVEMCKDFFNYWSEKNQSGKKMRFEIERTWELSRRLETWNKRQDKFNKGKTEAKQTSKEKLDNYYAETIPELKRRGLL